MSHCQNSSKFLSVAYLMKTADVIINFFSSYDSTDHTQLTKNVSGTFGFGCIKVWLNLTLLERNAYVRHWLYKCFVEPNVLKSMFSVKLK